MKRNKHEHVVGWKGDTQVVYGSVRGEPDCLYVDKMTYLQAIRYIKKMPKIEGKNKLVLYKLVPVAEYGKGDKII